jgi:hypothetical protein
LRKGSCQSVRSIIGEGRAVFAFGTGRLVPFVPIFSVFNNGVATARAQNEDILNAGSGKGMDMALECSWRFRANHGNPVRIGDPQAENGGQELTKKKNRDVCHVQYRHSHVHNPREV